MVGYKNTYLETEEIFDKISYIGLDNIVGLILLLGIIFCTLFFILYIYPLLSFSYKHGVKQRKSAKKKLMIRQIAMQREIEEEIEKEL